MRDNNETSISDINTRYHPHIQDVTSKMLRELFSLETITENLEYRLSELAQIDFYEKDETYTFYNQSINRIAEELQNIIDSAIKFNDTVDDIRDRFTEQPQKDRRGK